MNLGSHLIVLIQAEKADHFVVVTRYASAQSTDVCRVGLYRRVNSEPGGQRTQDLNARFPILLAPLFNCDSLIQVQSLPRFVPDYDELCQHPIPDLLCCREVFNELPIAHQFDHHR